MRVRLWLALLLLAAPGAWAETAPRACPPLDKSLLSHPDPSGNPVEIGLAFHLVDFSAISERDQSFEGDWKGRLQCTHARRSDVDLTILLLLRKRSVIGAQRVDCSVFDAFNQSLNVFVRNQRWEHPIVRIE